MAKQTLILKRKQEQQDAGTILGAQELLFLDEEDGNLLSDIHFKEKVVRLIRKIKPDYIFTHDPSWYYTQRPDGTAAVNHTDHRACGAAVLDAVYPLARDLQSFPHHMEEGLQPHIVPELYLFNFNDPTFAFDVTDHVQTKINAILAHSSQIDHPQEITEWASTRAQELGQKHGFAEAEGFTRLVFS